MNKTLTIIVLSLVFAACSETPTTEKVTKPEKQMTTNAKKIEGSIRKIDSIEKEIEDKEEALNKSLEDLKGL